MATKFVILCVRRTVLVSLTACSALVATTAQAQAEASTTPSPAAGPSAGSCPVSTFGSELPTDKEDLYTELNQLAPLVVACDTRADFHARYGAALLAMGWPREAATALEKALLLNPELAGTKLDYAHALALLGQHQPARDLVKQVVSRHDIQPGLRQWLQEGLNTTQASGLSQSDTEQATPQNLRNDDWTWGTLVQTSLGYEDNLNNATHSSSLTLYLSTGPVEVPLADSERPKFGAALKVLAAVEGVRSLSKGELRLSAAVQSRRAEGQGEADNQLLETSMTYALPLGPGKLLANVGLHSFVLKEVYNYKDQAYSLKYEPTWRWAYCKGSVALGRIVQRYSGSSSLNGYYNHLRLETGCRPTGANPLVVPAETIIGVTVGRDNPQDTNRPGGVKNRAAIDVRHETPMGQPFGKGQGTLTTWVRYSHSRDAQLYSTLLGAVTSSSQRRDIGVGYWWPLQSGWSVGMDIESTFQQSNNILLRMKNFSVYGGLKWVGK